MVLARIEVQMEDYPAAIGSYTRASAVRPDRVDLLTERLNLEERLMRFDDAAATIRKTLRADLSQSAMDGETRRDSRAPGADCGRSGGFEQSVDRWPAQ